MKPTSQPAPAREAAATTTPSVSRARLTPGRTTATVERAAASAAKEEKLLKHSDNLRGAPNVIARHSYPA